MTDCARRLIVLLLARRHCRVEVVVAQHLGASRRTVANHLAAERTKFIFTLALALIVALALKIVGALLTIAFLIIPAAAARP